MGTSLIEFVKQKLKPEYKNAFVFTFLSGLLVHLYKFTNYLPNHDSMYSFYNTQNALRSGRWLLSVACGFSSFFDLPWINGIFSLLFISLTSMLIVNIFDIKNKTVVFLLSGLMVTFPSTTEILFFEFTADGFFISMFLATLSVYMLKNSNKIINIILSAVLLCCSCGIYQAFVSFALVLILCYLIYNILSNKGSFTQYIRYIINQVIALVMGLISYFVIWKICMFIEGTTAKAYQGINEVGFSGLYDFVVAIKKSFISFGQFIIEKNILKHGMSLFAILNIIFILCSVIILFVSIKKSKIYKDIKNFILMLLCICVIPFAVFIWFFTSPKVSYALRMESSISILFIFVIVICDKFIKPKLSTVFAVLPLVIIINLGVQANIAYYYLNFEYENTYLEAAKISVSLDKIFDNNKNVKSVAIIGNQELECSLELTKKTNTSLMYTTMIEKNLLLDTEHTQKYLKNVFYFPYEFADDKEIEIISKTSEFKSMNLWSESHNVEIINNVAVIKFSELD